MLALAACQGNKNTNSGSAAPDAEQKPKPKAVKVGLKLTNSKPVKAGDSVFFKYESSMQDLPDSIKISIDYKHHKTMQKNLVDIALLPNKQKTGQRTFGFTFYWGDSLVASKQEKVLFYSRIKPENYGYKIIETFPHNPRFYTQGLEYANGYLFEGTGQYGESSLNKIDLEKNEVIQSINLDDNVFGEGITLINNKIYQLTWRSSTGFVYDMQSFKKLYDFSYPTEGWGLTNNGKELIMSDGSEIIYFLDMEYMQEVRRIEVYDDKGPVKNLNELEFINGQLFANVYTTNQIVVIDETSGMVLKKINFNGILDQVEKQKPIDVMNGIAWDRENERLIVTGKWWPSYFHVKLIKK